MSKPLPVQKVTKRRETDPDKLKPTGVVLNRKDLRSFKPYANTYQDAESLYLRENEFVEFDPYIDLVRLKILDLSMNMLAGRLLFLPKVPALRHLYLTSNKIDSLEGINGLTNLETLCMSDNQIQSFEGLDNLPNLRLLSLNYNQISSFHMYPQLPSLHTLNLVGNPVVQIPSYRGMAIALSTNSLVSIDGRPIEEAERAAVAHHRGKIVFCMAEGFVIEGDNVEEAADKFLLTRQRETNKDKALSLLSIRLACEDSDSNLLTENTPVKLNLCLQDRRDYETRTTKIFYSRFFFPVVFRMSGEASEAFVVGSMNQWADPIAMERCEVDGEVFFQTTLYLPAGDYEYRYIVDGQERVSDENKVESKYRQGECNVHHVAEPDQADDNDSDTILHIRWMRSDENNGFGLIPEDALTYTPGGEDIGFCLRAEVLAYVDGDYDFLYFDISTPVTAGQPTCTKLEILGVAAEGERISVAYEYSGGAEGSSTLAWFRVSPDGEEVPIDTEDPWEGYELGLEDIGHRIKAEFTPMRDDWVTGTVVSHVSAVVAAGVPTCQHIQIFGDPVEEAELTVETSYTGGVEGESTYQWFRHDDESGEFYPIPDATGNAFSPRLDDVGRIIAVEYTPISKDGIEGEPCRCVLDKVVEAAEPTLRSLTITGQLEEQMVLAADIEYFGGYFGSHLIQWYRHEGNGLAKIGRPNVATLTLTHKEVGAYIEVVVTPVRADGVQGEAQSQVTDAPVRPGYPQLKTMEILGEPAVGQVLEVVADYFGGEQGASIIEWARISSDNRESKVVANNTKKYIVQHEDAGCMLSLSYTPVRADGEMGETKQRTLQVPGLPESRKTTPRQTPSRGTTPRLGAADDAEAEEQHEEEQAPSHVSSKVASRVATPRTGNASRHKTPRDASRADGSVAPEGAADEEAEEAHQKSASRGASQNGSRVSSQVPSKAPSAAPSQNASRVASAAPSQNASRVASAAPSQNASRVATPRTGRQYADEPEETLIEDTLQEAPVERHADPYAAADHEEEL